MGEAFYTSNFIDTVEAVDGVAYVDLFSPYDNITPTGSSASPDSTGIGYNEIIIEGKRKTNYYYEKAPPPGGIRTAK